MPDAAASAAATALADAPATGVQNGHGSPPKAPSPAKAARGKAAANGSAARQAKSPQQVTPQQQSTTAECPPSKLVGRRVKVRLPMSLPLRLCPSADLPHAHHPPRCRARSLVGLCAHC